MQKRSIRPFIALALVAPAAACAELPDGVPSGESSSAVTAGGALAVARAGGGETAITSFAPTGPGMLRYYGGKLIARPRIYAINWNANVDNRVLPRVSALYNAVFDGEYVQWLTEYNTDGSVPVDGGASSNQRFGRGTLAGQATLTPQNTTLALTDAQIQQEIGHQIDIGMLPPPSDDSYYAVNFPTNVSITAFGERSCVTGGFCAYHGAFTHSGQNVYYGVLPSLAPGSGCNRGCGNAADFLENTTSTASHELVEAMTDAEAGLTSTIQRPLAWASTSPGQTEIGDICNQVQGSVVGNDGVSYTVQQQ